MLPLHSQTRPVSSQALNDLDVLGVLGVQVPLSEGPTWPSDNHADLRELFSHNRGLGNPNHRGNLDCPEHRDHQGPWVELGKWVQKKDEGPSKGPMTLLYSWVIGTVYHYFIVTTFLVHLKFVLWPS